MDDAYRGLCEAALRRNEALKRENQELRSRVEHLQRFLDDGGDYRPREDRAGASLVLTMLLSMIFLTGAVIYAGAMAGLQAAQGNGYARCPYTHLQDPTRAQLSAGDEAGSLRVELETAPSRALAAPSLTAQVHIDGRAISMRGGVASSGALTPGCNHTIVVNAPGYETHESTVCVHAGTANTLAIELTPSSPTDR